MAAEYPVQENQQLSLHVMEAVVATMTLAVAVQTVADPTAPLLNTPNCEYLPRIIQTYSAIAAEDVPCCTDAVGVGLPLAA